MQPIFKESQEIGGRNYLVTEHTSLRGHHAREMAPCHWPLALVNQTAQFPPAPVVKVG